MQTTLAPFLFVRNSVKALAFYKAAFGAKELSVFHDEAANQVIANLSIGASSFWLAEESVEHQNFSPETIKGCSARMVISIADPDQLYDRAIAAGATLICPVTEETYRWRIGRVSDPFGHQWEIGRPPA